jgi:peptidoglycan/LPS O-acetylase OafA/YrhL
LGSIMSNLINRLNIGASRDGTYLPTLDGWRAIAITLVIFAHGSDSIGNALNTVGIYFDFSRIKEAGLFGVQIFFGLSGLLITSRLIASEKKYGRISLKSFYIRRAFRILPAALSFLAAVGILALSGILPISFGRWLSSLFFLANYTTATGSWYLGHFWSLAVEEHFYMIWPAVFLVLGVSNRRITVAIVIALLLAFWRALDFKFQITGATPAVFWGRTDIQGDNILWGVVVALLYGDPIWKARLNKLLMIPAVLPSLIILMIILVTLPSLGWKLAFMLLTIKAILIPLMILGTLINSSGMLSYILETPIFRLIGRLSYSIYLWQQLFLVWNESSIPSFGILQSLPFNLIAVFACATISYLYIEKPFIAIGHRIASKVI